MGLERVVENVNTAGAQRLAATNTSGGILNDAARASWLAGLRKIEIEDTIVKGARSGGGIHTKPDVNAEGVACCGEIKRT